MAASNHQNHAVATAQVIQELIALAKQMREADACGEALSHSEDELRFCDALETSGSAMVGLGDLSSATSHASWPTPFAGT